MPWVKVPSRATKSFRAERPSHLNVLPTSLETLTPKCSPDIAYFQEGKKTRIQEEIVTLESQELTGGMFCDYYNR
jgi:hypothetical protein